MIVLDVCARFASAVGNITGDEEEFLDLLRSGYGSLQCCQWCNFNADSVPGSRFQKIPIRFVQLLRVCLFSDLTSLKKPILEGEGEEEKKRERSPDWPEWPQVQRCLCR